MRIDKRLHLVIPIYEDDEGTKIVGWVHSTPLAENIVDRYFMILGQTYSAIFSQGLGMAAGPGHALRVLRHIATTQNIWGDNPTTKEIGVERGLVEEMRRLTMVAAEANGKWTQLPLGVALDQKVISAEDKAEVENAIVFFTVAYATLNRAQRLEMVMAAADLWGARITSSDFTEWMSSLKTSTGTASSGEKSPAIAPAAAAGVNATLDGKPSLIPS